VRKQFRKERKPTPNKTSTNPSSIISNSAAPHRQIFDLIETDMMELGLQRLQPNSDELEDDLLKLEMPNSYPDSKIKCFAYILDEGYCVRANTLSGYCEANRIMLRDRRVGRTMSFSNNPNAKSQVDGIIGNIKSIGEKSSIKRCIIGNNCTIGDKVKLMNTTVMDNVTIEEGSNIQGSIVCSNAHIGSNAEIKDCIIAASQNVLSLGMSSK